MLKEICVGDTIRINYYTKKNVPVEVMGVYPNGVVVVKSLQSGVWWDLVKGDNWEILSQYGED